MASKAMMTLILCNQIFDALMNRTHHAMHITPETRFARESTKANFDKQAMLQIKSMHNNQKIAHAT